MIRMQTPSTNIGTGSIKTAFIRDKAVTGDKLNVTGALDHQVLTYDLASDTVVWDDVSNLDNTFENGIIVSGAQSQFNAELQVNANIDLNGDIAISGAITDLTSITADTTFSFDVTTGNLEFDVAGYIHADTTNLYVGSLSQAVNITGTTIGAIGSTIAITGDLTGDVTGQVSDLSNHDTADVAEGTNLYYTDARAQAVVDANTAGFLTAETNDLSANVVWANVPDANITQSSVTQHQAALSITESQISDLTHFTAANAVSAVEAETTLTLQEGLTVDTDILVGDHGLRDLSFLPLTGLRIVSPDDKVAFSGISLVEYGGDYADGDSSPFNIHLPILSGEIHGGSVASPAAVPEFKYLMRIDGNARYGTGTSDVSNTARIELQTNEDQTSTARGSQITFRVTPRGGTSIRRALVFNADDASVNGGVNQMNVVFDENTESDITFFRCNSTDGVLWEPVTEFERAITLKDVIVLENSGTAPATPATGSMYFDTGTNKFKGYNGTAWVDLG